MTELNSLKGIGDKTAGALRRLGIGSAEDLLGFYPRDYELYDEPKPLYALTVGEVAAVSGVLTKSPTVNRYNGLTIVNAYLSDISGHVELSWFNAPYIRNYLPTGRPLVFRGRVTMRNGRVFINQPKIFDLTVYGKDYQGRISPIYHTTRGLGNKAVITAVSEALKKLPPPAEYLSPDIRDKYSLIPIASAVRAVHFPKDEEELKLALRRLRFDEFFLHILSGRILSDNLKKSESRYRCRPDLRVIRLMAALPFELTKAQARTFREVSRDMNSGLTMNRLIEGDVGSGKTVVAMLAAALAAFNGYQAVLMAPTAVLARQHFETMERFFEAFLKEGDANVSAPRAVLLTGGTSQAEKTRILSAIAAHDVDIIIGTHALFQEKVAYADLGLVITDEQHRFGVSQREAIKQKGDFPHMLIMSATPIPRTLSLILYNGMDISLIDTLPEGRSPVKNALIGPKDRDRAYRFMLSEIRKGAQAYVICPAIERSDDDDEEDEALENVKDYTAKLKKIFPADVRILGLNGRMKDEDKTRVMDLFKNHEADILVSTTVVEVGVDVPEASVMLIENAERFGLAELHQLRGRVGRGLRQSYCMFVNTSESEKASERLEILRSCHDGFRIAEEDLRLRGPGDMFGVRQSGETVFRTADIYRDREELIDAGKAADEVIGLDPELKDPANRELSLRAAKVMNAANVL